ncbi:MAG: DUF4157 domain-containing protein, partial [Anaerolineae bacterium]|nr:DUF4157 domain-containing protein [Anaerolineae bacterium]
MRAHQPKPDKATSAPEPGVQRKKAESSALPAWAGALPLQTKLTVNQPGDVYEQEADAVADQVMRAPLMVQRQVEDDDEQQMPTPAAGTIQRQPDDEEEDKPAAGVIQRQADDEDEEEKPAPAAGMVQRAVRSFIQRVSGRQAQPTVTPDVEQSIQSKRGSGEPLSDAVRAPMEQGIGADLSAVRLHTDAGADHLSRSLDARAFTTGQDVFFKQGEYNPHSADGQKLLAHELVHTVQQGSSPSVARAPASSAAATAPPTASPRAPTPSASAPGSTTAPGAPAAAAPGGGAGGGEQSVDLAAETFTVPTELAAQIESQGEVPVHFGKLARGKLKVEKSGESYSTKGKKQQGIDLTLPALEPLRQAGINPVLAVDIKAGAVSGYLTIATEKGAAGNPQDLMESIQKHSREFGWAGIDITKLPKIENKLEGGKLSLKANDIKIKIGGFVEGEASFGLENEAVTFAAKGHVRLGGLTEADVDITRDEKGVLSGNVEIPVQ